MSFSSPEIPLGGLSLNNFAFNYQPKRQVHLMPLPRLFTQLPVSMGPRRYHFAYPPHEVSSNWRSHNDYKPSFYPPPQQMLCKPSKSYCIHIEANYATPVPPSPSDSISSVELSPIQSSSHSPLFEFSPQSRPIFVQCTAPLIAPKPLPYHSPRFLQFDELPELDEDLSHAPYVRRPLKKRKRENEPTSDEVEGSVPQKRRMHSIAGASKLVVRSMPRSQQPRMLSSRRSRV